MTAKIADDLGRLFEVGFNIGILSYIYKNNIQNNFGNLYRQELSHLNFAEIKKIIIGKIIGKVEREIVDTWCQFFIQKGFLCGLNFFREYLQSWKYLQKGSLERLQIIYYQCRFNGDNSIGTYEVDEIQWFKNVLSQWKNLEFTLENINNYKKAGHFLNADSLMLLKYNNNYRVLCLDLSVFSIHTDDDLQNIDYVEIIRGLLLQQVNYLRSKSVFSKLCIDTESLNLDFSSGLKEYFTAFKYHDKESVKLIQASSYIYSFCQFLKENSAIPDISKLICNAVGYSDRSFNTISIPGNNLEIFSTCHEIYRTDASKSRIEQKEEISQARHRVLDQIKSNAHKSFAEGKKLVDSLLGITPNSINILPRHTEKLTGFFNSVSPVPSDLIPSLNLTGNPNFRQAHNQIIKRYLLSENTYIFLTGNPGIGKTTAIVDFLSEYQNDGFLLLYVSPRKQVNLDIIEKFKDRKTRKLVNDQIFAINSHGNLIQDNGGKLSVAYTSNKHHEDFTLGEVDFLNSENIERKSQRKDRLQQITDNIFQDMGTKSKGVLNSICQALYRLISCEEYNQIIATTSTQSLKKTDFGDTSKHLGKIFQDAYKERDNKVFPEKMQKISRRIKHLFIMIDEITGDEGGVEFLEAIGNIVKNYELTKPENGFNTKIIVADASIVDKNVICQHLEDTSPEPNKVYFRTANANIQPLSVESFTFKKSPAIIINTNTYPAQTLTINYQIIIESRPFTDRIKLRDKSDLEKTCQTEIFTDIQNLLQKSDVEQFIVYIQNKSKLSELIDKIQSELGSDKFVKNTEFLEIHANISEAEKQEIKQYQESVKVIFMTASGSRGLSFPKAKHILVEIPKFEIEKNLMEIIQVIYRGRGNDIIDNQDKYLTFYLAERSIYHQENSEISIKENSLSLLNLLLILKASIMTRIQGYGSIGRNNYLLIPIGGKSVFAAGETFSSKIENLITQLKKEYNRNKSHLSLKDAYTKLELLMSDGDFCVSKNMEESYLKIRENFNNIFLENAKNFDKLLDFIPLELGYIHGGLLIVPSQNIQESYQMRFLDIKKYANAELWNNLKRISRSQNYPESLTFAVKDAIELVEKLINAPQKTQNYIQNSQHTDQYYALPLFAFISSEVMKEYFESNPEEPEDQRFKDILSIYIRSLYPVTNLLPIGHNYKEFPFLVFRSYNLEEIRKNFFTKKYLLNSQELNILNLILSQNS